MNKICLIIVVCFLANTQGSPRTKRALAPGYRVEDFEKSTEQESDFHCVPASKPRCCPQKSWDVVKDGDSGIEFCRFGAAPNPDPCAGETDWQGCLASKPIKAGAPPGGVPPANCQFPFTYEGRTFNECTYYNSNTGDGEPWCRTVNNDIWNCLDGCPGV